MRKAQRGGRDSIAAVKDVLTILAIVGGGIWAIYTLYAQHEREDNYYRGRAVALSSGCKIEFVGATDQVYLFTVNISIGSSSRIRVFLFDAPYVLRGIKLRMLETAHLLKELRASSTAKFQQPYPFQEAMKNAPPQEIAFEYGRLWSPGAALEPGEKIETSHTVALSKATLDQFEVLNFYMALILTENPARLGAVARAGDQGQLDIDLLVYDRDKREPLALTDESIAKDAAIIPVDNMLDAKNAALLKSSNTAVGEVDCGLISPAKLRQAVAAK